MKVVQYLGKLSDGHDVVLTDAIYMPFVIVTRFNPHARPGNQWDSAYGYYSDIASLGKAIALIEQKDDENEDFLLDFDDEEDFEMEALV